MVGKLGLRLNSDELNSCVYINDSRHTEVLKLMLFLSYNYVYENKGVVLSKKFNWHDEN